jgi:hypothetical protein
MEVYDLWLRASGLGFMVKGLEIHIQGLGFRV